MLASRSSWCREVGIGRFPKIGVLQLDLENSRQGVRTVPWLWLNIGSFPMMSCFFDTIVLGVGVLSRFRQICCRRSDFACIKT